MPKKILVTELTDEVLKKLDVCITQDEKAAVLLKQPWRDISGQDPDKLLEMLEGMDAHKDGFQLAVRVIEEGVG